LLLQRLRENQIVVHSLLVLLSVWGFALALFQQRERATLVLSQVHRSARLRRLRNVVEPYIRQNRSAFYRRVIEHSNAEAVLAGNRLLVLKPPLEGEKGVLLVMFGETLDRVYSCMDVERLIRDYTLVFEPSYPGYCHPCLLQYTRFSEKMFVLAPVAGDFAFLQHFESNLVPVDLGPCDWVDPRVAEPYLDSPKDFDIVMNAIWARLKRHFVLFEMLARAKRRYNVALIGVPWGRERAGVEREAEYYGVRDQLTFFESIPYNQVMDVTCRSRVSILLSLKEAGNRAIAESIFCNVPVIVLRSLVGGIVKHVGPDTGIVTEERDLESAVEYLIGSNMEPRDWALEHISCLRSSTRLSDVLREHSLSQGFPWSTDIAVRCNSPECGYFDPSDAQRLAKYNSSLRDYLRC
jgi:glycosyltransferase involved in cell wall biosynthesis